MLEGHGPPADGPCPVPPSAAASAAEPAAVTAAANARTPVRFIDP
jgi:hypothetical protein